MKNRDYSLDFLAGILLLQIIYNHCCSISKSVSIDLSFLAFYMPWFFYKGGMFFKTLESKQMLMGGGKVATAFYEILHYRVKHRFYIIAVKGCVSFGFLVTSSQIYPATRIILW